MMPPLSSLTMIFIATNKSDVISYQKIVDSTQVKRCRGIWQVFAKRQNSRLFLTLTELQFSNLSNLPVYYTHDCVSYLTSEFKNTTLNKF